MRYRFPALVMVGLLAAPFGAGVQADIVTARAGLDFFETDPATTYDDLALPPGFLVPFCDAGFTGRVFLRGERIPCFGGNCDLGPTDTIVRRNANAAPPSAVIPIEIVALELRSVAPITVSCTGGAQTWNIIVSIPEGDPNQTPGTMTVNHTSPDGGTFDSVLPVTPQITFKRVSDSTTVGPMTAPTITFTLPAPSPWCHTGGALDDPPGDYLVETNLTTPSNFYPGCLEEGPAGGVIKRKVLTEEEALQAKHGVLPAEKKNHYKCFEIAGPAPVCDPVSLANEFGFQGSVEILQPRYVCPPALKNGGGDLMAPHLKCYDIVGNAPGSIVDLRTQFGVESNLRVGQARMLCAVALKTVVPDPLTGVPPPSPHYTCYSIAGPPPGAVVDLETQFGLEPGVTVGQARFKCVPTIKNGGGTRKDPDLKCYDILGSDPPHVVNLRTQFGDELNLPVGQAKLMCIPAKELRAITPVPALGARGLIALALLLLAASAVLIYRRRRRAPAGAV